MGYRMSDDDWSMIDQVEEYTHTEARMIAEEYTWGWASCWFASTGEFAHDIMISRNGTYAAAMDQALFGWWADSSDPDDRPITSREQRARYRMRVYLDKREANDDMGPVEGFSRLWPARN